MVSINLLNNFFMPSYIFLTAEGSTLTPNHTDIENLQVLGTATGESSREALDNLLQENEWIKESDYSEAVAMELNSEKVSTYQL